MKLAPFLLLPALACAQVVSIDCGGSTDRYFTPVAYPATGWTQPWTDTTAGTTLRFGPVVSYSIPVGTGLYTVVVTFVEPSVSAVGARVQTITVQGQASDPLDIFAQVGAHKPLVQTYAALVGSGPLRISFAAITGGKAVVSAIKVYLQEPAISLDVPLQAPLSPGPCPVWGEVLMDVQGFVYACLKPGLAGDPVWWRTQQPMVSTWTQ